MSLSQRKAFLHSEDADFEKLQEINIVEGKRKYWGSLQPLTFYL
jgi:hypothetical protein